MVSWGCQQHPSLIPECDLQVVGGGGDHGTGQWLLGSFLGQACSKPSIRLFLLVLTPHNCSPRPSPPCRVKASHTLPFFTPGPLGTSLPVPRAGDLGAHTAGVRRTSASAVHCSGRLRLGRGHLLQELAVFLAHAPGALCQCFLLPGLGLGSPGPSQRHRVGSQHRISWASSRQWAPVAGVDVAGLRTPYEATMTPLPYVGKGRGECPGMHRGPTLAAPQQ